MKRSFVALGALAVVLGVGYGFKAQERAPAEAVEFKAAPLFNESDLPGRYYQGDGLGVNLSLELLEDHTFTFRWNGCLGEYDRNEGRWKLVGDTLVLEPERPHERTGFNGMDTRFIPVPWGSRLYLVDENELPGFAAAAREGVPGFGDGLHGSDYVKRGTPKPSASDKPLLPARYQHFFSEGAIEARISSMSSDGTVLLDKGGSSRLAAGMLLVPPSYEEQGALSVLSVTESSAVARPFYYFNESKPIRVGQVFSTGGEYHRPRGTGFRQFSSLDEIVNRKS